MNKLFYLLLAFALLACTHNESIRYDWPDTDVEERLYAKTLNDTYMFGRADDVLQYDSLIIIFDPMQENKILFFNKDSGLFLGAFGRTGQGDKEIILSGNLSLNSKTGILSLYDYGRGKMLSCQLDNIPTTNKDNWFVSDLPKYETNPGAVIQRDENAYVGLHGRPWITLSRDGEIVASVDTFPDLEVAEDKEYAESAFFLLKSLMAISPNGKKMVVATTVGSILETFDVGEETLTPQAIRYFHKPIFTVQRGQICDTPETIYGFTCLQATDNYIYATILGKANPTSYPNTIYVFDWKGNPVKKLVTDQQIYSFTVDEQNEKIYAIIINEETGEQSLCCLYKSENTK